MSSTTVEKAAGVDWEELENDTDIAAGTNYYPDANGFLMRGFNDLSILYAISGGVTLTIEASQEEADEDPVNWVDITEAGYDLGTNQTGSASFIDLTGIVDFDNLNVQRVRLKSVTSDGTNSVIYRMRRKQ